MKSKILGLLTVGLLAGPVTAQAVGVVVGDREWRQLTATTNLTWNQVVTVCSPTTGACGGSIGGASFDGWTWAVITDIQALFDRLIQPGTTNFPTLRSNYHQASSADIAAVFGSGAFTPTWAYVNYNYLGGFTRDIESNTSYTSHFADLSDWFDPTINDNANISAGWWLSEQSPYVGAWLYRPAPVPEPAPATLLVLGLLAMAVTARTFGTTASPILRANGTRLRSSADAASEPTDAPRRFGGRRVDVGEPRSPARLFHMYQMRIQEAVSVNDDAQTA